MLHTSKFLSFHLHIYVPLHVFFLLLPFFSDLNCVCLLLTVFFMLIVFCFFFGFFFCLFPHFLLSVSFSIFLFCPRSTKSVFPIFFCCPFPPLSHLFSQFFFTLRQLLRWILCVIHMLIICFVYFHFMTEFLHEVSDHNFPAFSLSVYDCHRLLLMLYCIFKSSVVFEVPCIMLLIARISRPFFHNSCHSFSFSSSFSPFLFLPLRLLCFPRVSVSLLPLPALQCDCRLSPLVYLRIQLPSSIAYCCFVPLLFCEIPCCLTHFFSFFI